jgi:hypothetical protein
MKARLLTGLIGPGLNIGDLVEGEDALRLCESGFAVPVREEPEVETADAVDTTEKAVRKPRKK